MIQDLEAGIDALAELFVGAEFADALEWAHSAQKEKINVRGIEYVYVDEVEQPDGYPCLEVIAVETNDEDEAGDSDRFTHEISLQFTVNGDDEEIMSRELKRLIRAARKVLKAGNFSPLVGGRFRANQGEYGRSSPGRTEKFVQSAALRVYWVTHGI